MRSLGLLSILIAVICASDTCADDHPPIVTVDTTASLKRTPDWLRMNLDVVAQGKNGSESIVALNKRKQELLANLGKLGVDSDRAQIGGVVEMTSRFVVKQFPQGGAVPNQPAAPGMVPGLPFPPSSEPVAYVKAAPTQPIFGFSVIIDFELTGESDNRRTAAADLQQKIRVMDLGGLTYLSEGTACESCGPKAGVPYFTFVSKLSELETDDLYKAAIEKARTVAVRWSKAAGGTLGSVQQIVVTAQRQVGPTTPTPTLAPPLNLRAMPLPSHSGHDQASIEKSDAEVAVETLTSVEHRVAATVTFVLLSVQAK